MDAQVTLGHVINTSILFLDQNGNPMLTDVKSDAPPSWSNLNTGVETVVASADGMSAVVTPIATGVDTVSVALLVNGKPFAASLSVNVSPAPQVLTSVQIVPAVV